MKKQTKDIFMYALGALVAVGTFVLIAFLLIYREEMRDIISMSVGTLMGAFGLVIGYFYGSSKGSGEKNEMLYRATPPKE